MFELSMQSVYGMIFSGIIVLSFLWGMVGLDEFIRRREKARQQKPH
jgi:hypothetical protein